MRAEIKAIVFKTTQLKATRDFFENILKLQIKESSARHFVLYSKSIRVVFVESLHDFGVEIFIKGRSDHFSKEVRSDLTIADFKNCRDPNGISIMIT
jgi:catechol-2,3-dioxygenase